MLAEQHGHSVARDLFRHAFELEPNAHPQAAAGFVEHALNELRDAALANANSSGSSNSSNTPSSTALEQTSAEHAAIRLPAEQAKQYALQAAVAAQRLVYTADGCGNAWAFNMLGVALEGQQLMASALDAFRRAHHLITAAPTSTTSRRPFVRQVQMNLARVLSRLGQHADAIAAYTEAAPQSFAELCGFALCQFSAGNLQESHQLYDRAAAVASNSEDAARCRIAQAIIGFTRSDLAAAKVNKNKKKFGIFVADSCVANGVENLEFERCRLHSANRQQLMNFLNPRFYFHTGYSVQVHERAAGDGPRGMHAMHVWHPDGRQPAGADGAGRARQDALCRQVLCCQRAV